MGGGPTWCCWPRRVAVNCLVFPTNARGNIWLGRGKGDGLADKRYGGVCVFAPWAVLGMMPGMASASSVEGGADPVMVPQDSPHDGVQLMAHAAILSDYRFRGLSYSEGEPVVQASLVAAHESGLYGGVFVSSLGNHDYYGAVEVDFFAGWAKAITPAITADVSLLYYYYPDGNSALPNIDSFETALQLTGDFGAFSPKVGIWYAWEQAALGGKDNLYLFGDLVWRAPGTPLEAKVHAGYTDGAYSIAADRTSIDWSAGVGFRLADNILLGVEYVGMGGPKVKDYTDDTIVASLSMDF